MTPSHLARRASAIALAASLLATTSAQALPAPSADTLAGTSGPAAAASTEGTSPIDVPGFDEAAFAEPTDQKPAVLWFWDRPQTEAQIDARLESMHAAGFTETVIFRWFGDGPEPYFSQAWFDRVEHLLSKSEELGMKVWLDDDAQFPSGAAGGLIVNGGTVGDTTYEPRPDLRVKALSSGGSVVRDGGRPIELHSLFGRSLRLEDGEVVADAGSIPGITLLREGADWTDYRVSASFRIVSATAGFMVRSPDQANGYLIDVRADGGIDVWRQLNGGFSLLRNGPANRPNWNSSSDAVHDIEMTVNGTELDITLDGVSEPTLAGLTDFGRGRVGMRVDGSQHWRLDDLEVTSIPDAQTLFADDFTDEASVDAFETAAKRLEDVVVVTARPAVGEGAADLDQVIDVTEEYLGEQGTWQAPAGRWRLEAYRSMVREGDRSSYVDSMSYEAQELYQEIIFGEYAERFGEYFGSTLLGFADDEPEVGRHGDDLPPWSPDLGERLADRDIDLAKAVTAIYHDMGPEGDHARARYYRAMSDQWVDAYWRTKYEWAESQGIDMISNPLYDEYGPAGRLHESGNLMTMHQWAQIPGTDLIYDHLDKGWARSLPREPASVAHQLGRPLVYDELMGATGWDQTIADVRRGTATSAVRGVNKALFHATFDANETAPYPPVFAADNVWWKFVPSLTTWTGRLMEFGRHETAAPTALVQMQRAAESAQRRDESAVDEPWIQAQHSLEDHQVDFDLVDEGALSDDPALLAHAEVTEDGRLQVGEMAYRTVVVPTAPLVSLEAMQRLLELAQAGGEVVLAGPAPSQELEGRDEALAAVVAELKATSNHVTTLEDVSDAGAAAAELGRAAVTLAQPHPQVRVLRFDEGGSTGYLLLNEGVEAVSTDLTFPDAGVPAVWDFDSGDVTEAATYRVGASSTTLPMTLQPDVPVAVTVSPQLASSPHATEVLGHGKVLGVSAEDDGLVARLRSDRSGPVEVTATDGTAERTGILTVPDLPAERTLGDDWQMQLDNGSQPVTRPLTSWHDIAPNHSGDATYTRSFEVGAADLRADWTLDLGRVADAAVVRLNGQDLGALVHAPFTVDLGEALVEGINTLTVTVTNTDANSRNQVRPSGLLGPVVLRPYSVVESTLAETALQVTAAEAALSENGAAATVTVTVTNTGVETLQVQAAASGDGWRAVSGPVVDVPAGGSAVVTGYAVPTDFVNDGDVDLLAELSVNGAVVDLHALTFGASFDTPPTRADDHVDLGEATSEAAHGLTASSTSGTNTEAGLTRRYAGYRVPDAWYEFDLAAEAGKDLLLQGTETYNDMAQHKSYFVYVDGELVGTRSYVRPLTEPGTVSWRLLVPAEHVTADTVRVRFQSSSDPDLADPSLADVWATSVEPVEGGADVDTTAPKVEVIVTGTQSPQGVYDAPATVTVTADDRDGSGVDTVELRVDGGEFRTYTGPVDVTEPGERTVEVRARDRAGNTSELAAVTFSVAGAPEVVDPEVVVDRRVRSGDTLGVQLSGYPSGSTVTVELHGRRDAVIALGEVAISASGAATADLVVPAGTARGRHELVARSGAVTASVHIVVTGPAVPVRVPGGARPR